MFLIAAQKCFPGKLDQELLNQCAQPLGQPALLHGGLGDVQLGMDKEMKGHVVHVSGRRRGEELQTWLVEVVSIQFCGGVKDQHLVPCES